MVETFATRGFWDRYMGDEEKRREMYRLLVELYRLKPQKV